MNDLVLEYKLYKLVKELDKEADRLLRKELDITYKRFHFLLALSFQPDVTQHELAATLGYSDPAISTMLRELVKTGYVRVQQSSTHARKRIVNLEPSGEHLVKHASQILHKRFLDIVASTPVDIDQYDRATRLLLDAARELNK